MADKRPRNEDDILASFEDLDHEQRMALMVNAPRLYYALARAVSLVEMEHKLRRSFLAAARAGRHDA